MSGLDIKTKEYVKKSFKMEFDFFSALMDNDEDEAWNILSEMYTNAIEYFYTDEEQIDSLLDDDKKLHKYIEYEFELLNDKFNAMIDKINTLNNTIENL